MAAPCDRLRRLFRQFSFPGGIPSAAVWWTMERQRQVKLFGAVKAFEFFLVEESAMFGQPARNQLVCAFKIDDPHVGSLSN